MSGDYQKWFADRAAKAERQSAPVIGHDEQVELTTMQPLSARLISFGCGLIGVLVAYTETADEQRAFNIAATLLPEGVKLALDSADWTYLPPTDKDHRGYIGWQLPPAPLKSGEFYARAWTLTSTAELKVEDVVVTRESLAELQASGKYFLVDAHPRSLDEH